MFKKYMNNFKDYCFSKREKLAMRRLTDKIKSEFSAEI